MAITKGKAYYKTVRRAAAAVNGATSLKEKQDTIVRGIAGSMKAGALLALLDSTGEELLHSSSWGLPYFHLRKGGLDAGCYPQARRLA